MHTTTISNVSHAVALSTRRWSILSILTALLTTYASISAAANAQRIDVELKRAYADICPPQAASAPSSLSALLPTAAAWPYEKYADIYLRQRLAKSLHFLDKPDRVVFLGSSTVYRGMNPDCLVTEFAGYNLGISSLRMKEAAAFAQHYTRWKSPRIAVVGLELFQFDGARQSETGFDPTIERAWYTHSTILAEQLRSDAERRQPADTTGEYFLANGFCVTTPRSEMQLSRIDTENRAVYDRFEHAEEPYRDLTRLVRQFAQKGTRVILYFSPFHDRLLRTFVELGLTMKFEDFKRRVTQIATDENVELFDFSSNLTRASEPLTSSNITFIDQSHFSPILGARLMNEIGLPLAPGVRARVANQPKLGLRLR